MGCLKRGFYLGCAVAVLVVGAPVGAAAAGASARPGEMAVTVSIPGGSLADALMALAAQTRLRLFYTSDLVAGRRAGPLAGRMTPSEALARLLAGTGLEAHATQPGVLVLRRMAAASAIGPQPGALGGGTAVESPPAAKVGDPAGDAATSAAGDAGPTTLDDVLVIGSHIRGVRDGASPVVVISRDDIDRAGYASVADALSALPQAFGGVASEQASSTHVDQTGTNDSRANGVNLRGFGAGATLVLVNGRRMAGTGSSGDFADVSAIPLAAVERIEVLLDGASALYGSDAVGGVVNIVLRTRFDGAETRATLGGAAGGYGARDVAQTFGRTWSSGHALFAYEYQAHDSLPGRARAFAGDADLRGLGGGDWRQDYAQPGNILGLNSAHTAYVPLFAIPAGQNGVGLTAGALLAGQVNLENQDAQYDLLPRTERHSLYAAVAQGIGPDVEVSADARYSRRTFRTVGAAPTAIVRVTPANPYFVSPTGGASTLVAYSFANELGGTLTDGVSESLGASAGLTARLPAGWQLNAYGAFAQEHGVTHETNLIDSAFLNEAVGNAADNPATAFSTARDGFFNPFIGQGANARTILDFIRSGYERRENRGRTLSVNLKLDGALFSLPGGPVRLAVGGQWRRETLKTGGESLIATATPSPITTRDVGRDVTSLFGELNIPVFGEANAIPGFERLELSVAGRFESYQHVASTTNPKVGLIWSPLAGVSLKASYGTSFRAPTLPELNNPYMIAPSFLPGPNGNVLSLILVGGNPGLKPETATSWTAGVEFRPNWVPGLKLGADAFDTTFANRIDQPALTYITTVLTDPEFAPFRTFVNPASSVSDLAAVNALLSNPAAVAPTLFPASAYGAIADARFVNTGVLHVRGVDFTGAYSVTVGADRFDLQADVSWLDHYERKVTPLSPSAELAGVTGYPAALRGRFGGAWTHGPFSGSLALNLVGASHDAAGHRVGSWTTVDLQGRWQPRASAGPWRGVSVSLTMQNAFDADPPFYNSPLGIGYDPANTTALGRVISVQLTKLW